MDASFGSNGNQNNTISLDKNNETNNLNNMSDAEVNAVLNKYSWGAFSLGLTPFQQEVPTSKVGG